MDNTMKAKILAYDAFDPEHLKTTLGPDYDLTILDGPSQIEEAAIDSTPDIILLPHDEPGVNIGEICTSLGNHYNTAHIPVIALLKKAEKEHIDAVLTQGAVDYVHLPLIETELKSRINTHFDLSIMREKANPLDELTGVLKKHAFIQSCQQELIRFKRNRNNLVLAAFHIDQLEEIENKFGEEAADYVFTGIVLELKHQLRDTDLIGRLEKRKVFIMLIETSRLEGILVSDRIRNKINRMVFNNGKEEFKSTISVGFTPVNKNDEKIEDVICRANKALGHACKGGDSRVEIE